jgi:pimeloyl-ACP methyl ester carboxylesterase
MGCDGWCHDVIVMDRGTFVNSVDISPRVAYRSHVIDVDSSPVAWREAGSGPVAVFLHGLGGGRTAWRPQLEVLSEVRRCVAWDAPGYGASDPVQDTSFDAYARAALSVIDTVSPGEAVDLVGMSFGGMIAQYATALAPERIRSLTLLCTSPKFGLDGTDPDEWRAARLAGLEQMGSPAAAAPLILPSLVGPNGAHVLPEAIAAMGRVPLAGLLDSLSTIASHDSRALLPAIVTPTLVLVGELDDETPVTYGQAIVDLLPNGRLEVIPGVGHLLNLEAEDAVNTAIARHWQEVTP